MLFKFVLNVNSCTYLFLSLRAKQKHLDSLELFLCQNMYTLNTNLLYKRCMTSDCFLPRFHEERALTRNMINKMSAKMREEASRLFYYEYKYKHLISVAAVLVVACFVVVVSRSTNNDLLNTVSV